MHIFLKKPHSMQSNVAKFASQLKAGVRFRMRITKTATLSQNREQKGGDLQLISIPAAFVTSPAFPRSRLIAADKLANLKKLSRIREWARTPDYHRKSQSRASKKNNRCRAKNVAVDICCRVFQCVIDFFHGCHFTWRPRQT